jgi:alpha-beta hydrolase superfamily lysophospholipase
MIAFADELYEGQFVRTLGHAIYGGADFGEMFATAERVRNRDAESWLAGWRSLADRTLASAQASRDAGDHVGARDAYLRASNYYRNASVFHLQAPMPDVVGDCYRAQRDAFTQAGVGVPFDVPLAEGTMPAWFFSGGEGRRPLVVSVGGYDGTAEESYFWNAAAAVARGYHCVTFDGPGQGGMLIEQGVPLIPDFERAVTAVIDAVAARPDVDAERIVLVGESLGGYLASRAAACDARVAACILDPAQPGVLQQILARVPLPASVKMHLPDGPAWAVRILRQVFSRRANHPTAGWSLRRGMLVHGVQEPWEYVVAARRFDDARVTEVRCPTLVADAEDDDISAFAKTLYDSLTCPKRYVRFASAEGSGRHCVGGNRTSFHREMYAWLQPLLVR